LADPSNAVRVKAAEISPEILTLLFPGPKLFNFLAHFVKFFGKSPTSSRRQTFLRVAGKVDLEIFSHLEIAICKLARDPVIDVKLTWALVFGPQPEKLKNEKMRKAASAVKQSCAGKSDFLKLLSGVVETDEETEEETESQEETESRAMQSAMQSETFASKTIFSQEKYLLKKHKKYAAEVTLLEPTLMNLSEAQGSPIRWDALALILRYANATAQAKVLLWDDAAGLPTASLLQRQCQVTRLTAGKGSNSAKGIMDLGITTPVHAEVRLSEHALLDHYDSLIIVSTELITDASLTDIVAKTLPAVSSACGLITVYTRFFEAASELQKQFRLARDLVNVTMTETFFREHQIMDQRTHPLMQSEVQLFQGFIVNCMKIKE
jgi:tRNA (adenine-N(1)-)-methyltransferase non-catalytic subunit